MNSDSEDDYDYISDLKSGFNHKRHYKTSINLIDLLDTESDTETESDDCVIVDYPKSDKSVDQPKDNTIRKEELKNESNECPLKEVTEDSSKSSPLKSFSDNLDDLENSIQKIKEESQSRPQTIPLSDVKSDIKPDLKPDIKPDIKPFILKVENEVKVNERVEESLSCPTINTLLDESIQSNQSKETQNNKSKSDSLVVLMDIIEKICSQKQRPIFDRILIKYKKVMSHESDPQTIKSALKLLLKTGIENNFIKEFSGRDENDIAYRVVDSIKQKNISRNRMSSRSNDSELSDTSNDTKQNQNYTNAITFTSDNSMDMSDSNDSQIDSLALEGYTDINDIDISSAKELFGEESNEEINPNIFELYQLPTNCKTSPTSESFNSTPIKSFNHNRNKEVIRKQLTATSSTSGEELDKLLSFHDYQDWLMEKLPRYSPYIAQKGDKVVYLKDAHQIYYDYELKELNNPYKTFNAITPDTIECDDSATMYAIICDVKFYQINYIKFSVIKMKSQSNMDLEFTVIYRPNRGICDFLVLQYYYEESKEGNWRLGQEFRSLWKKSWWTGTIISKSVFDTKYPNSLFRCFKVMWNTEEKGRLSPWDLFPIDINRLPKNKKNGILINRMDMLSVNYHPTSLEWPEVYNLQMEKWRCQECKRLFNAITFFEKEISVDIILSLNEKQKADVVYPITLSLIKERLKNLFYRRKESIIEDISYIKTNAGLSVNKKYYQKKIDFVRLFLNVVNDITSIDENKFKVHLDKPEFNHLRRKTNTPSTEEFSLIDPKLKATKNTNVSTSLCSKPSNLLKETVTPIKPMSPKKKTRKRTANESQISEEIKTTESTQWKIDSQRFIDELMKNEDSLPYRQPVDTNLFPFYLKVISQPIDLSDIQSKLSKDHYANPIDMRQDFRLMFQNAKAFSKDPNSKMRTINKSLSNKSEDRLREIIVDWQRVYDYEQKLKKQNVRPRKPTSRNKLWGYREQQYY